MTATERMVHDAIIKIGLFVIKGARFNGLCVITG